MRKKAILITGSVGEIGQALIDQLSKNDRLQLISLDIKPFPAKLGANVLHVEGDILDESLLSRLISEYDFELIFHLAALLSTRSEFTPQMAHRVNVDGTLKLLKLAAEESERSDRPVRFIFPSSIAAYGLPNLETKQRDYRVREWEWNNPITMYGCNKLYCELLGNYFSNNYQQLAKKIPTRVDFRSLRFPGLISAFTVPSGGTSDYAPEMIHAAAQGIPYQCFVREDTRIPFMAMPDAINALLAVAEARQDALKHRIYNITSFSLTADEVRILVKQAFSGADIKFVPDNSRQRIVDSWPADLNDSAAREDWGWQPIFDVQQTFNEYLIPNISNRYLVR